MGRRFIPTRVGNMGRASWGGGSSPPAWGIRYAHGRGRAADRFIPTPVGNTPVAPNDCSPASVHPHARGEYSTSNFQRAAGSGSSPRPWGILLPHPFAPVGDRFIPTPVGNTWPVRSTSRITPVHPHARGEHFFRVVIPASSRGSSPRPWGTPWRSQEP